MPVETEEVMRLWETISNIQSSINNMSNEMQEIVSSKSTNIALDSLSDAKYPSVKAVKTYVNSYARTAYVHVATETARATNAETLKEDSANKSTTTTLGTSDILFPTQKAVKAYVDASATSVSNALVTEQTNRINADLLKENVANKSTTTTLGTSDVLYPTQNAVKIYVDAAVSSAAIADASVTTKGKIKLAQDLGGTADAPTVPGLSLKENSANKSTTTTLGTSDVLYPTQNAVKTYVDAQVQQQSDYRIKTDVQTLDETYTVDHIRPVTYKNTMTNKQDIGVIAHELQEIYPFLVNGEKDGEKMQSVNYTGLFGILIREIQQLKQEVKELREQIAK